jgi:branched-subunit amino acid aminotransferase/4-amino-4-deoxychorismate lyase
MNDHCRLRLMEHRPGTFELLETMKWTPLDGFFLLDRHLARMRRSARHFNYKWIESSVLAELAHAVSGKDDPQRIRLLVSPSGTVRVDCSVLGADLPPAKLGIAKAPIDPANVFLRHKTTYRAMYADAAQPDCDDVVLWTPEGYATETTLGNLVVEIGGRKVTPPIEEGLLAGTFREELLARGEIVEGRVTLDDVKSAPRVWIINSVREWWPAEVQGRPEGLHYMANDEATTPTSTSATSATAAKRSQR